MENIGNPDAEIRDEIVYMLLTRGIDEGSFNSAQFNYLVRQTMDENLIFYQMDKKLPATLTRSFAALLNGNIIEADGNASSAYYHRLSARDRDYFFESACDYLSCETDKTGFSPKFGWVHAFAHAGDYLSSVVSHDLFARRNRVKVLKAVADVIENLEEPFKDEEERRIANVFFQAVVHDKLSQIEFKEWIETLNFPLEKNADYYRLATFKNMLAYFYFHAIDVFEIELGLKKIMLSYLKRY